MYSYFVLTAIRQCGLYDTHIYMLATPPPGHPGGGKPIDSGF